MRELSIEEKELLLKDLSARLPYGVIVATTNLAVSFGVVSGVSTKNKVTVETKHADIVFDYTEVKPYLRPMSSMTKEEKLYIKLNYHFYYHDEILDNINIFEAGGYYDRDGNYDPPCEYREIEHVTIKEVIEFVNWLNAHHFDYRGLIEKGLALEAQEGMYNIN